MCRECMDDGGGFGGMRYMAEAASETSKLNYHEERDCLDLACHVGCLLCYLCDVCSGAWAGSGHAHPGGSACSHQHSQPSCQPRPQLGQ